MDHTQISKYERKQILVGPTTQSKRKYTVSLLRFQKAGGSYDFFLILNTDSLQNVSLHIHIFVF